jgi:hypothetical protein
MDARGRKLILARKVYIFAIPVISLAGINDKKQEVKYEFIILSQIFSKPGTLEAGRIMCYLEPTPQFLHLYVEKRKGEAWPSPPLSCLRRIQLMYWC